MSYGPSLLPIRISTLLATLLISTTLARAEVCNDDLVNLDAIKTIEVCTQALKGNLTKAQKAAVLYDRGRGYHRSNRTEQALEEYKQAIALAPKADMYVSQSWGQLSTGQGEEAIASLKKALALDPKSPRALDLTGFMYLQSGDPEGAWKSYSKALEIDPDHAMARLHRLQLMRNFGRLDEAMADANYLINQGPEKLKKSDLLDEEGKQKNMYAYALIERGGLHIRRGDQQAALDDYAKAVAAERSATNLQFLAGQRALIAKDFDTALAEAKEATTLAPMNPYARRTYGSVLSQMRRWDEAETQYRHAVALFPQAAKYYVYLAQVLRKQNKIDEAVASIEEAISRDKSSVQSLVANMRSKGYWNGEPNTFAVNAQVKDGIRACMIDQTCFF